MDEAYQVPVRQEDRIRAGLALQLVAASTGVPKERMEARTRLGGRACRARWLAMYLAYVIFQWPLERVGAAFGRDRTTAGHACRQIEDLRDDRRFDDMMERLEACLRLSPCAPGWIGEDRQ